MKEKIESISFVTKAQTVMPNWNNHDDYSSYHNIAKVLLTF